MRYCNPLIFVLFLLSFPFQVSAQKKSMNDMDLTGLWKGFMYNDTTQLNYRYEIAISENKGKLFGYSHTYFILDDKEYHGVKKIRIKRDGNEVTTEDVELIANNYPIKPPKGVHVLNTLKFEIKDTVMVLSGMFSTNRTREYAPATGFIHVERKNNFRQSALIPHLEELGLSKNLSFLTEENYKKESQTVAVIKPVPVAEEEKIIEAVIKKQQEESKAQATATTAEKETPSIKKETKPAETVVTKPVIKTPETVITKPAPVKSKEPAVTKVPTTSVKPAEPVVVNKPAISNAETPAVAKASSPEKPTEPGKPKQMRVNEPDRVDAAAAVDAEKRKVETIEALYFKSDSLQLILYDNGEVDGDTVSVLMNGKVIMPRVGLTTNAVKKTIYTEAAGDSIQIVMYAETLGSLPPNTGLLIVYDGTDRYEIRFSGDMSRSSAIVFRRRK